MTQKIQGAHLVGSAPVEGPEHMFRLMSEQLGNHLGRLSDGEVGERDTWIAFQAERLGRSPQLELAQLPPQAKEALRGRLPGDRLPSLFRLVEGVEDASQIELPALGYADAAIASYGIFSRLKSEGVIPSHIRFMVGLPTPLDVATGCTEPSSRPMILAAYQRKLFRELGQIAAAIPHDELSIQWETVFELMMLEGLPMWQYFEPGDPHTAIEAHLTECSNAVPESIEMGWHLCYGDAGHRHFIEPKDTQHLTWMANAIAQGMRRPFNFLHIPVPKSRNDVEYFAPLDKLRLHDETELYLGLVHVTGGEEGTLGRIEAAKKVVKRFGVATECGWGRRAFDTIPNLFEQIGRLASPRGE